LTRGYTASERWEHSTMTDRPTEQLTKVSVLLYSDDAAVRDRMRQAIGARPTAELSVSFIDTASSDEVIRVLDSQDVDLLVLDGEATPAGGLGIARQLRDELDDCPPICVVIARAADRWLAAYSRVDATLTHPLDPITTGRTVAALLGPRLGAKVEASTT
jgi:DNA-binding response OmpR family regulator